eukprot:366115-Chlamydomonas_euryale.AAC.10
MQASACRRTTPPPRPPPPLPRAQRRHVAQCYAATPLTCSSRLEVRLELRPTAVSVQDRQPPSPHAAHHAPPRPARALTSPRCTAAR